MRLRHASLLLAVSAMLPACASPDTFCTLEARAAVQVTVMDTRGGIQRDARVTFTVDGGPEEQALCNGGSQTGGQCDRWVAGYERAGEYVITATSADGTRTARTQVRVGEDECHVKTETVQLTLPD
jgi:hypothetical protein